MSTDHENSLTFIRQDRKDFSRFYSIHNLLFQLLTNLKIIPSNKPLEGTFTQSQLNNPMSNRKFNFNEKNKQYREFFPQHSKLHDNKKIISQKQVPAISKKIPMPIFDWSLQATHLRLAQLWMVIKDKKISIFNWEYYYWSSLLFLLRLFFGSCIRRFYLSVYVSLVDLFQQLYFCGCK